ncbi:MAG: deoxyguanosinetriphosphate triphosphohydrolase [Clostridiales bacterium]|nr:deoxyguanosinetriphosphate triphosphohydrolase [Clostridiales bacterium]
MIKRADVENREYLYLSPYATKAAETRGRIKPEEKCEVRTDFQRDRDRIIHSKSFRRLMHKTQVFLSLEGDHFRTRLTHTIEVAQIARTIARGLALNEDLTEAIAMGHDLGHTPFGHSGEYVLNKLYSKGFRHNQQSLRVVDVLEFHGNKRGMNLTAEVRDGILNHTGSVMPFTPEGQIVKTSDRIAYINHDIDDAIRSGVISADDLPSECIRILGDSHKKRIDTLVKDMISNSEDSAIIRLSDEKLAAMNELRSFMFENVYHNIEVKSADDAARIETVIETLYRYYSDHPELIIREFPDLAEHTDMEELVKDHIAGMTDRYAENTYQEIIK